MADGGRGPALVAVAFGVLVVFVVAGCGLRAPVETFTTPPDSSPGGALVDGVLQGANGCVLLLVPGQRPVALLFEDAYTATFGPLQLYDPGGTRVATEGQHVWLGIEGQQTTSNPACGTTDAWWVYSLTTTDPVKDGL